MSAAETYNYIVVGAGSAGCMLADRVTRNPRNRGLLIEADRTGDRSAVADERLRVFDLTGLRIADAAVMPCITSGNTNSPTMMNEEKAAEMILADAKGPGHAR